LCSSFNFEQLDGPKFWFAENIEIGPMEDDNEQEEAIFAKVTQVDPHFRFRGQAFPVRVEVVSGRQIVPFFH
jgi:hypothetical protein